MNPLDELMDGEAVDPREAEAWSEALHGQLCMDAALAAHFGGTEAELRVRAAVLAAVLSTDETVLRQEVLRDARLRRPLPRQHWTRVQSVMAAAAAIVLLAAGWWMMRPHSPQKSAEPLLVAIPPDGMRSESGASPLAAVSKSSAPILQALTPPSARQPVADASAPKALTRPPAQVVGSSSPSPAPASPPAVANAPMPSPPVRAPQTAPTMAGAAPPAVAAAKPAADGKPSLGTPPPASITIPSVASTTDKRDPALWPFSASSPWNAPIGSGARLEPVLPAEFARLPVGFQPRTIFRATTAHTLVRIKHARGATLKVPFSPEWADVLAARFAPVSIIEPDGRWAVEYHGLQRDGGDWRAADGARISLLEDGIGRDGRGVGELGLPALAGVIRAAEWQDGIHHVVGIIVPAALLNAKAAGGKAFVWPAQPEQAPDTSGFGKRGNLHLGTLLALPADAHPDQLGLARNTSHYQLALALWAHGARILGGSKEGREGISLITETLASGSMDRAALAGVLARLKVVANSSASRPGGGGTSRCAAPPPFAPVK